jgi:hypothetical protein
VNVTAAWVRLYTAGLPPQVREARCAEIRSDVHEQLAEAGDSARALRRARRAVVGRTVRGAVDDVIWRREVARRMKSSSGFVGALTQSWWAPVAALVGVFDLALGVQVLTDSESTMPGRVIGPVLVCTAALAIAVGLGLRAGPTTSSSTTEDIGRIGRAGLTGLVAIAVLALAVAVVGGRVGVLLAALLVVVGVAAALSALGAFRVIAAADVLLLLGVLPALAMFWMVVPTILALVVIAGLLTSRPRAGVAAS